MYANVFCVYLKTNFTIFFLQKLSLFWIIIPEQKLFTIMSLQKKFQKVTIKMLHNITQNLELPICETRRRRQNNEKVYHMPTDLLLKSIIIDPRKYLNPYFFKIQLSLLSCEKVKQLLGEGRLGVVVFVGKGVWSGWGEGGTVNQ